MTQPASMPYRAYRPFILLKFNILNHFLDNALAKTATLFFSDHGFLYSRRSPMAGTFTKDLTKGCGINKYQRSGLICIQRFRFQ